MTTLNRFIGDACHEDDNATYFHGFKKQDVTFGALSYCLFKKEGMEFFAKIHSCWWDKAEGVGMAEIQPFQYVPDSDKRTDSDHYHELFATIGDTMEIRIKDIIPKEVHLVWVPPDVPDDKLIDYTEKNVGKKEYKHSLLAYDSEDDEDDDDFIVLGEVWGFYQYCVYADSSKGEQVFFSPSPQFMDRYMTFESTLANGSKNWWEDEFIEHILHSYLVPKFNQCFPGLTQLDAMQLFTCIYNHDYIMPKTSSNIVFKIMNETYGPYKCDRDLVSKIDAFILLFSTLIKTDKATVIDIYNFCLKFSIS